MRLRSVWISQYKNLRDFSIGFDGEGSIDIFVGRNGSGKSNFLEAIIEIFDHVYEPGKGAEEPCFDYKLEFSVNGEDVALRWQEGQLWVNGRARSSVPKELRPQNVIVYYSGQNPHVAGLIKRHEDRFRKRLRGVDLSDSPAFIGIGPEYKKLLILLLLLLPEDRPARRFLCVKLGILGTRNEVVLTIGRPITATRRSFDHLDPDDLFWGVQGVTRTFLMDLIACIEGGATPGALHDRQSDLYSIPISVPLFRRVFGGRPPHELFQLFSNLKMLGMLDDISMTVTLNGLELSDVSLFSDGQFQSVYLFAIAELFKERESITLLDEPDAFLHPEWQFEFLNQTNDISDAAARSNHILMSSHSAVTLINSVSPRVKFFELNDGAARCYPLPKRLAIERLSNALIRYTESEQLLSILNAIQIENKPVMFTEGSIDPIIIKEAWYRLYQTDLPFIPFYAFSCTYLSQLLRDDRIINDMGGRPVFGLFDFDQAFNQWNGC